MTDNRGRNFGSANERGTNLGVFVTRQKNIKMNGFARFNIKFFDLDFFTGSNDILLAAGSNDCDHREKE